MNHMREITFKIYGRILYNVASYSCQMFIEISSNKLFEGAPASDTIALLKENVMQMFVGEMIPFSGILLF